MMNILEQQLLVVLITALIGIIPTAGIAIKAYLQAQTNKLQIENRPTHDEVSTSISNAVDKALADNGTEGNKK